MYGVPPRGHLHGQNRDNSNTRFFTLKRNTYTRVLIEYLLYIYVLSYLVWKDLLCLVIFHTRMECISRWKFMKNKKRETWSMHITKISLAGRVQTQLIKISVSLGGDKLDVTLSYASASQAAFSLGNFKVSWRLYPRAAQLKACVVSSLGSKSTKLQLCPFK